MTAYWPIKQGDAIGSAGALTTVTLAGVPNKRLQGISAVVGYDAEPQAGTKLVIKSDSTVILSVPVTAAGPAPISLEGFTCEVGEDMVAELSAPGGAVLGYVNLVARVMS